MAEKKQQDLGQTELNVKQEPTQTILASAGQDEAAIKAAEDNAPIEWKIGDVILDRYEVKKIHEGGGMGLVYKAYHRGWKVDLAVKSPRQDFFQTEGQKENFTRECETWINLGLHPNIVSCYYVRTLGDIPRVFAEYVEGGSLSDWIKEKKLYEGGKEKALERILDIAIQFAWGLQYAHEQGLVHQDVKPANLMITTDGTAKVTDFGLAKARAMTEEQTIGGSQRSILVSSGGMTPAYCSPEQASHKTVSRKTDIWSWGLSVLEMFTGGVNWMAGQAAADALKLYRKTRAAEEGIPKMPKALGELLDCCFQWEPESRPQDMPEIVAKLQEIYRQVTGRAYPGEAPKPAEPLADSLNNRALSCLDLGKEEEAERCWREALKKATQHPQTVFNLGYWEWYKANITDDVYMARLKGLGTSQEANPAYWYHLGLIQLELGEVDKAMQVAKKASDLGYDETNLAVFRQEDLARIGLLKTLEGHSGSVNSVCISPDGRYALSGSDDKTLRLWDIAKGKCLKTLEGHTGYVKSVCFSSDGRYALSGSRDKTLRLWDVASGQCLKTLEGHTEDVLSVCISPDVSYALSGSDDKTLRLWDIAKGKCLKTLEGHTYGVASVSFSPVGSYALSGSWDGTLRLWDIAKGKCLKTLEGHITVVYSVSFSPDGRYVLSGSDDKTLRLWDIANGKCLKTLEGHIDWVKSVCISPDGYYALSGGRYTLRLWDIAKGKCLKTFGRYTSFGMKVNSVSFSPDGRYALSGSIGKPLSLWELGKPTHYFNWWLCQPLSSQKTLNVQQEVEESLRQAQALLDSGNYRQAYVVLQQISTLEGYERSSKVRELMQVCALKETAIRTNVRNIYPVKTLEGHTEGVNSICFSPDGRYALSGSDDKTLRLWEVATGHCLKTLEGHIYSVESVSFSPDGRFALSGSYDNTLRLWDLNNGNCLKKLEGHTNYVYSVCFSPDGHYALSGSWDNTLRLWDLANGKCLKTLGADNHRVRSACFSPDGRYALSGSGDETLRLWDLANGKCLKTLEGHTHGVSSVCFSPDGRFALSGSKDKTLRHWDLASGLCLKTLEGHTKWARSVCFSPDGRYALSGSYDETLRLWDIANGKCLKTLEGHTERVYSVCFSPDGYYALSGSGDKTLFLWEFDWEWKFPKEKKSLFSWLFKKGK